MLTDDWIILKFLTKHTTHVCQKEDRLSFEVLSLAFHFFPFLVS